MAKLHLLIIAIFYVVSFGKFIVNLKKSHVIRLCVYCTKTFMYSKTSLLRSLTFTTKIGHIKEMAINQGSVMADLFYIV